MPIGFELLLEAGAAEDFAVDDIRRDFALKNRQDAPQRRLPGAAQIFQNTVMVLRNFSDRVVLTSWQR